MKPHISRLLPAPYTPWANAYIDHDGLRVFIDHMTMIRETIQLIDAQYVISIPLPPVISQQQERTASTFKTLTGSVFQSRLLTPANPDTTSSPAFVRHQTATKSSVLSSMTSMTTNAGMMGSTSLLDTDPQENITADDSDLHGKQRHEGDAQSIASDEEEDDSDNEGDDPHLLVIDFDHTQPRIDLAPPIIEEDIFTGSINDIAVLQDALITLDHHFFAQLDAYIDMVNRHYIHVLQKISKLELHARKFAMRVENPQSQRVLRKQYATCHYFRDLLRDYIQFNYVSCVRLLKAHDSALGVHTLGPYLNSLHNQPFYYFIDRTIPYTQPSSKEQRLRTSSSIGDDASVELELSTGADINAADQFGNTALMLASLHGHIYCVLLLLKYSADINKVNHNGTTALIHSVKSGHAVVTFQLLEAGADPNPRDDSLRTALMYSSEKGDFHVSKHLISAKADVNIKDRRRQTALLLACEHGHANVVEILLQSNASLLHRNDLQQNAVSCAASGNHIECLKIILKSQQARMLIQTGSFTTILNTATLTMDPTFTEYNQHIQQYSDENEDDGDGDGEGGHRKPTHPSRPPVQPLDLTLPSSAIPLVSSAVHGNVESVELLINIFTQVRPEMMMKRPSPKDMITSSTQSLQQTKKQHYVFQSPFSKLSSSPQIKGNSSPSDGSSDDIENNNTNNNTNDHHSSPLKCQTSHPYSNPFLIATTAKMTSPVPSTLNNVQSPESDSPFVSTITTIAGFHQPKWPPSGIGLVQSRSGSSPSLKFMGSPSSRQAAVVPHLHSGHHDHLPEPHKAVIASLSRGGSDTGDRIGDNYRRGKGDNDDNDSSDDEDDSELLCVKEFPERHIIWNHIYSYPPLVIDLYNPNRSTNENTNPYAQMSQHPPFQLPTHTFFTTPTSDPNKTTVSHLSWIDVRDKYGCTALLRAAEYGNNDVMNVLLKAGANPNATRLGARQARDIQNGDTGDQHTTAATTAAACTEYVYQGDLTTALMLCALHDNTRGVQLLLEHGANVNYQRADGSTALLCALDRGLISTATILLEHNADVSLANDHGHTPLIRCAAATYNSNYRNCLKLLIKYDADVNARTKDGATGLIIAATRGVLKCIQTLCYYHADVNAQDSEQCTALIRSAMWGHTDVITELLKYKADVNLCDNNQRTALFYATAGGFYSTVALLLEHGANPSIVDCSGVTAKDIATSSGHMTILPLFRQSYPQHPHERSPSPLYHHAHAEYPGHSDEPSRQHQEQQPHNLSIHELTLLDPDHLYSGDSAAGVHPEYPEDLSSSSLSTPESSLPEDRVIPTSLHGIFDDPEHPSPASLGDGPTPVRMGDNEANIDPEEDTSRQQIKSENARGVPLSTSINSPEEPFQSPEDSGKQPAADPSIKRQGIDGKEEQYEDECKTRVEHVSDAVNCLSLGTSPFHARPRPMQTVSNSSLPRTPHAEDITTIYANIAHINTPTGLLHGRASIPLSMHNLLATTYHSPLFATPGSPHDRYDHHHNTVGTEPPHHQQQQQQQAATQPPTPIESLHVVHKQQQQQQHVSGGDGATPYAKTIGTTSLYHRDRDHHGHDGNALALSATTATTPRGGDTIPSHPSQQLTNNIVTEFGHNIVFDMMTNPTSPSDAEDIDAQKSRTFYLLPFEDCFALRKAAFLGDIDALEQLLSCFSSRQYGVGFGSYIHTGSPSRLRRWVDLGDQFGNSALILAASAGRVQCVSALVAARPPCNVNIKNSFGRNALMSAARKGYTRCMNVLLSVPGIQIEDVDEMGNNVFHLACKKGHHRVIEILLRVFRRRDRKRRRMTKVHRDHAHPTTHSLAPMMSEIDEKDEHGDHQRYDPYATYTPGMRPSTRYQGKNSLTLSPPPGKLLSLGEGHQASGGPGTLELPHEGSADPLTPAIGPFSQEIFEPAAGGGVSVGGSAAIPVARSHDHHYENAVHATLPAKFDESLKYQLRLHAQNFSRHKQQQVITQKLTGVQHIPGERRLSMSSLSQNNSNENSIINSIPYPTSTTQRRTSNASLNYSLASNIGETRSIGSLRTPIKSDNRSTIGKLYNYTRPMNVSSLSSLLDDDVDNPLYSPLPTATTTAEQPPLPIANTPHEVATSTTLVQPLYAMSTDETNQLRRISVSDYIVESIHDSQSSSDSSLSIQAPASSGSSPLPPQTYGDALYPQHPDGIHVSQPVGTNHYTATGDTATPHAQDQTTKDAVGPFTEKSYEATHPPHPNLYQQQQQQQQHDVDMSSISSSSEISISQLSNRSHKSLSKYIPVSTETSRLINTLNRHGHSPLFLAAANGHGEVVETLLRHGAYPDYTSMGPDGIPNDTPLITACLHGFPDIAEMLITYKANIHCMGLTLTPLNAAAMNGHFKLIKVLLRHGTGVERKDRFGSTPLIRATRSAHLKCVMELILAKANVDALGEGGTTALITAASEGRVDILKALLLAKANVDLRGEGGATALIHAADKGYPACVQLLLDHGADPEVTNIHGHTALMRTVYWNRNVWKNHGCMLALIYAKANVNAVAEHGNTTLHIASYRSHTDAIRLLIEAKADVNLANCEGITPLMRSAAWGFIPPLKVLLEGGALTHLVDNLGRTALWHAVALNRLDAVQLLLLYRSPYGTMAYNQKTPLDVACDNGFEQIASLLQIVVQSHSLDIARSTLHSNLSSRYSSTVVPRTGAAPTNTAAAATAATTMSSTPPPPNGMATRFNAGYYQLSNISRPSVAYELGRSDSTATTLIKSNSSNNNTPTAAIAGSQHAFDHHHHNHPHSHHHSQQHQNRHHHNQQQQQQHQHQHLPIARTTSSRLSTASSRKPPSLDDMSLVDVFETCRVGKVYHGAFLEQGIETPQDLFYLNDSDIARIIPQVGPQRRLQAWVDQYRSSIIPK